MATSTHKTQTALAAFLQSAGAKLLIIALNAMTGILSARALQPAGRGELAAMILWYTFLGNAFTLGIPSALTYQVRRHPERKGELVGAALVLALFISVAVSLIGYFGLPHWIPQYSSQVLFYARLFLLVTPMGAFFIVGRAAIESQGKFKSSNFSLIIPPFLTTMVLLVLWGFHALTPVAAAWAYVPAGIPSFFYLLRSLRTSFTLRLDGFGRSVRSLLSYGIRSYGIDLCGTMSIYVDQALVVRILQPGMMGTYVVALSLSRMLNAFHTAAVMVLFPKAVSRPPAEVVDLTGRTTRLTTSLTLICGLGIAIAGPHLLRLLYGAEYGAAATILRILVVEVILAGATTVMSQAFMALARPGVITALQALGLLLTIPLMLVLVPRYGIAGAAVSLLLSTCARFAFVSISFSMFLHLPRPDLLLKRSDIDYVSAIMLRRFRSSSVSVAGGRL